jgi:hypothetical protein
MGFPAAALETPTFVSGKRNDSFGKSGKRSSSVRHRQVQSKKNKHCDIRSCRCLPLAL